MEEVTTMKTVFCMLAFTACLVSSDNVGEVEKAFTANEIDKDMIKPVPQKKLEVFYPKTKQIVNLGNELTPKMSEIPHKEWQHWLVVNIPGSDLSKGEVLNEYVGSGPPKDSGLHRYVFVLFKQPGKITFTEPKHSKTDGNRGNFSVKRFAEKYNMGNAIAGNFFQAKFDDSAFIDNQLDQDIIKAVPKNKLEVFYEKPKLIVNLGNELAPKNVIDAPQVIYESDPQAFYTLSMVDPDVPSRSSLNRTEWSHWLVVNIPGSDLSKGEVLDEYIGPMPLKDTGLHRYVFLLFKQPEKSYSKNLNTRKQMEKEEIFL
ncbi:hypothetical protein WA026_010594 [Henosepilachna vigintioctopunctata]|uniref:Uncharacterized protein n=1 Tax=Henosepilachna vigintioctopunctata TaxID=420089 RepID=A0AAW1VAP6_9CUCU